jgi:O-antigen/teichoic acid export membrane protein
MKSIRTQAIISGIVLYAGFAIGAINIFLYNQQNSPFSEVQFGLTRLFTDVSINIFSFGSLGTLSVLYKFFPYYNANLPKQKNDLLTWVLVASILGFVLVALTGYFFKPLVVQHFSKGSLLFVEYYFWVFPLGLGLLLFSVVEVFALVQNNGVATNFLKETVIRIITTLFIVLYYVDIISFDVFIKLFSLLYFIILVILILYLFAKKQIYICFTVSHVTKKFWRKMLNMQVLMIVTVAINALRTTVDGILISGLIGLGATSIFTLAQYVANLVQVPQRSLQTVSVASLLQAWKQKNVQEVSRIYSRSCINMLIMALFIYGNAVLNMAAIIPLLGLKLIYLQGIHSMIILGLVWVIEAGTGVNSMVILTSSKWRFDLFSGIVVIVLIVPLNYFFIKRFGIIGSAYAQLIAFAIYNYIRFHFIWKQFNMQPFNAKTVKAILSFCASFFVAFLIGYLLENWIAVFTRGIVFSVLFIASVFAFSLTPDATQLWDKWKHKLIGK